MPSDPAPLLVLGSPQCMLGGTPLVHEEKGQVSRDQGLSTAGSHQATQVPETTANKWGLVAKQLLEVGH